MSISTIEKKMTLTSSCAVPISSLNGPQNIEARTEYFHQFRVEVPTGTGLDFGNHLGFLPSFRENSLH
jgi:hypothetical protein